MMQTITLDEIEAAARIVYMEMQAYSSIFLAAAK